MNRQQKINDLEEELDQIDLDYERAKKIFQEKQKEIKKLKDRKQEALNELRNMRKKEKELNNKLAVTDHALIRYMERVHGLDIGFFKAKMISELPSVKKIKEVLEEEGECYTKLKTGHTVVCRDDAIITVYPLRN